MIRKIRKNKSDLCDGRQNAQGGANNTEWNWNEFYARVV